MSGRAAGDEPAAAGAQHFEAQAAAYAAHRPTYPAALFDWLADATPRRSCAWDCATGSGQAAVALARHFARVVATDTSPAQLAHAVPAPGVEYRVAPAEASGLPDASADLVTVAQALHWFDRARFYGEARRVLAPGGVLAVWSYGSAALDEPALADALSRFEHGTMGPYWPPERALVGEALRAAPFPFRELAVPPFTLERHWTLAELLGYVRSWSATAAFVARHRRDPVGELAAALGPAWGEPSRARRVWWPMVVRAGRAD